MRLPTIRGIIDRRILVNYRVNPHILSPLVPAPFRPQIVRGFGLAGICLIRLKQIRPALFPTWLGISSENAAHRIAVEWDENVATRTGVFVRRRDTNSRLNSLTGGRIFPGIHHHARFTVQESSSNFNIAIRSDDSVTQMSVQAQPADHWLSTSIFHSLEDSSAFFQAGSLGYSATADRSRFQGLELRCRNWRVEPLEVEKVHSSFFEDISLFPKGSIEFDCALLMRHIEHEWHGQPDLCCSAC